MSDIVERLLEAASRGKPDGNMMLASSELFAAAHLLTEQADEIERLRDELANIRKMDNKAFAAWQKERGRMSAENDRLRAELSDAKNALFQAQEAAKKLCRANELLEGK